MSYSNARYQARFCVGTATCTGTWPATASAGVGTATDLTFVLPRVPHPTVITGMKIYRTGTGGTFTGVKAIVYNGTNALGTTTSFTLKATTDEIPPLDLGVTARAYPFYQNSTDTAVATATMKLTGTTTASIAATNEILAVVFDFASVFDNTRKEF